MKPIPGFDGYFATVTGEVVGRWGRQLSSYRDKDGYRRVTLAIGRGKDAQRIHRGIHQLVCLTYHGPAPDGYEVRHLDGTKDNNRPHNVAWATHKQNLHDRRIHGTMTNGERHWNAKLTRDEVRSIRILGAMEIPTRVLAQEFKVSRDMINRVISQKNWRECHA